MLNIIFLKNSEVSPVLHLTEVKVTQSCPILCDPMNYIQSIEFPRPVLEWVAFPFSRGSFCILVLSHLRVLTYQFFYGKGHSRYSIAKCI